MPSATARDSKVACDCQDPTGSRLRHHTGWTPKERGIRTEGRYMQSAKPIDCTNTTSFTLFSGAPPSPPPLQVLSSTVWPGEIGPEFIAAVANLIFGAMIGRVAIVRN